jgi:putative NADH-flavin reductase
MHIAVIGATGHTGQQVVTQALERGADVSAIARNPNRLAINSDRLTVTATDVLDPAALTSVLAGSDAVVSALGVGTSRAPTDVYSRGVANVLTAMAAHGIRRLAVISAAPAGPRAEQPLLERRVIMPILDRLFGATYRDMRKMEAVLDASDLDWTCLRPPRLVDRDAVGHYRIDVGKPPPRSRTLTFADLAAALLDSLDETELWRQHAYIAN